MTPAMERNGTITAGLGTDMKRFLAIAAVMFTLTALAPVYQNYYVTNPNPTLSPAALALPSVPFSGAVSAASFTGSAVSLSNVLAGSIGMFNPAKTVVMVDGDSKAYNLSPVLQALPWWTNVAAWTNVSVPAAGIAQTVAGWSASNSAFSSRIGNGTNGVYVFWGGHNDLGSAAATVIAAYSNHLAQVASSNWNIVLLTTQPRGGASMDLPATWHCLANLNNWFRLTPSAARVVDAEAMMPNNYDLQWYQDTTHLTDAGNALVAAAVADVCVRPRAALPQRWTITYGTNTVAFAANTNKPANMMASYNPTTWNVYSNATFAGDVQSQSITAGPNPIAGFPYSFGDGNAYFKGYVIAGNFLCNGLFAWNGDVFAAAEIAEFPPGSGSNNPSLYIRTRADYGTNFVNVNIAGKLDVTGNITSTNFVLLSPQWIDIPMNYGFSVTGPSAPALTAVTNASAIQELAFDNGDMLYAQAQMPHTIATTNSLFPSQYIEPHVHFSTIGTLDATHSNVTWRVEWELASINGQYSRRGTNTVTTGVDSNGKHFMAELGHITNNPPLTISAVFRCRLMRPASGAQDYSNSHDVLLDGLDLHVPIGNVTAIGSRLDSVQ